MADAPNAHSAQKSTGWWHTLPGVLTALAGVITAVSGLIALLYQNGVLGHKDEQSSVVVTPPLDEPAEAPNEKPTGAPADVPTQAPPKAPPGRKPWSEAVAVVVGRDGSETKLRAESFSNCISANHELTLTSGQDVPFERMSGFEVTQADEPTSPNAKARLTITLVDGTPVTGVTVANCDLFGYNDLGRYTTYFNRIRRVTFER
ncbi:MAG: hypothetical protein IV110_10940 [Aquabacterium sp.]|uniref:hypothetical protein n=1 Tax=Aquabacterium sp. TaxID=1872578 RepID=UPI001D7AD769|nr:hypothetical protein [Aquabacterium sp.]MBT9610549.1 hypothetical protein [Aquabacterium sp.]